MSEPSLFVATPLHNGWLHRAWVAGALQSQTAFAGRIQVETFGGSFLPMNRDMLTARFLDSQATHMLCVDSDIGWHPEHAQALLDTGKQFISGCYAKKQANRAIPVRLTGKREADLWEAESVPGGFVLLAREVVERMWGAYRSLCYRRDGIDLCALWMPLMAGGEYCGEDVSFCVRWRKLGGQLWMHPGVVVDHWGEHCYVPDVTT